MDKLEDILGTKLPLCLAIGARRSPSVKGQWAYPGKRLKYSRLSALVSSPPMESHGHSRAALSVD